MSGEQVRPATDLMALDPGETTMNLPRALRVAAPLPIGIFLIAALAAWGQAEAPDEEPAPVKQIRGTDLGGNLMTVYVARDKATWDQVKDAVGTRHNLPRGSKPDQPLDRLDGVDFQQDMIVAVFWGEMNFSGHEEKCWIEAVTIGEREVTVDCRASLWGGAVNCSYCAWPYEAKVVQRSELPVLFKQTTEYPAQPQLTEKDKVLATLKTGDWKQEVALPK